MVDASPSAWGHRRAAVAVAVVYWPDDGVDVHLAEDDETLTRVLALRVVAATDPAGLGTAAAAVRTALSDGRYADAIVTWMEATGARIDGFPDERVWRSEEVPPDAAPLEFHLTRLFSAGG